ncbi:FAD/NAD(P)-binding protein [Kitasatospora sp. NPDC054939]
MAGQPSPDGTRRRIGIIGAGAAGTLAAARLLREAKRRGLPVDVDLVDPSEHTGRGLAFGTRDPRHLLNVPAGRMSAHPEEPDHFVRWLAGAAGPADYVPRMRYGDYLADVLAEAPGRYGRLHRVRDRVVGLTGRGPTGTAGPGTGGPVRLALASGAVLTVDAVVLAVGHLPPDLRWAPPELLDSDAFVRHPWGPEALRGIPPEGDVLLVGTGLTMVDVALTLDRPGRTVHAVSRHGYLPQPHAAAPVPAAAPPEGDFAGFSQLRREVLRHIAASRRRHGDWRPGVDSLRPITQALWQALPPADRERFLREDLRMWEVHRHRIPPATGAALQAMRRAGRLRVAAGEVAGAARAVDGLLVRLADGRRLRVAAVVNCTGAQADPRHSQDPLLAALLADGTVRPGPCGRGLDTWDSGLLRAAPGRPALWALGPVRSGNLLESTAVPELRTQAAQLALSVLDTLAVGEWLAARGAALSTVAP